MLEKGGTPMIYGNVTGRHIERRPGWHCQRARRVLSPSDSRRVGAPFSYSEPKLPNILCARINRTGSIVFQIIESTNFDRESRIEIRGSGSPFLWERLNMARETHRLVAKIFPKHRGTFAAWQIYCAHVYAQVRGVRCLA